VQELVERIRTEGTHVGDGIVKLDGFLNHQVDPALTERMGVEFVRQFEAQNVAPPDKIITAEVSGIPAALATARIYDVPVLYARKHQSSVMNDVYYFAHTKSRTKGGDVNLLISKKYLSAEHRVLIIDDFLATGSTMRALTSLIEASGATLLGIGCVVEKPFEHGRDSLSHLEVPIVTLAKIELRGEELQVYS
jgi:xanthine phosphoribosyltransferase